MLVDAQIIESSSDTTFVLSQEDVESMGIFGTIIAFDILIERQRQTDLIIWTLVAKVASEIIGLILSVDI